MNRLKQTSGKIKQWFLYIVSFSFCKHEYKLVNQFEMESEYDIIVNSGRTPNTHTSIKRLIVTDYKCKECGKIKRLTAKTCN